MAQKVTLLNGVTVERDTDYTACANSVLTPGVVNWGLEVTNESVAPGIAFIKVTRNATTPSEEILVKYENTVAESIDTSGTKKVWIAIEQANVNDPGLNVADGTGVGSIQTGANYPTSNYIPLASIDGGIITDERKEVRVFSKNLLGEIIEIIVKDGGNILTPVKQNGDIADVEVENLRAISDIFINWVGTNLANGLVKLTSDGKILSSLFDPVAAANVRSTIILWEDRTAGDPIRLWENYTEEQTNQITSNVQPGTYQTLQYREFTVTEGVQFDITEVRERMGRNSGAPVITCTIRDSSNNILKTASNTVQVSNTNTYGVFDFSGGTPLDLDPNTTYRVAFSSSSSSWYLIGTNDCYIDIDNTLFDDDLTKGYLAKADSLISNGVIGILNETWLEDELKEVVYAGLVSGLSGLTTWKNVYLQDDGSFWHNKGTRETIVGVAVSTSQIIMRTIKREVEASVAGTDNSFWLQVAETTLTGVSTGLLFDETNTTGRSGTFTFEWEVRGNFSNDNFELWVNGVKVDDRNIGTSYTAITVDAFCPEWGVIQVVYNPSGGNTGRTGYLRNFYQKWNTAVDYNYN